MHVAFLQGEVSTVVPDDATHKLQQSTCQNPLIPSMYLDAHLWGNMNTNASKQLLMMMQGASGGIT